MSPTAVTYHVLKNRGNEFAQRKGNHCLINGKEKENATLYFVYYFVIHDPRGPRQVRLMLALCQEGDPRGTNIFIQ